MQMTFVKKCGLFLCSRPTYPGETNFLCSTKLPVRLGASIPAETYLLRISLPAQGMKWAAINQQKRSAYQKKPPILSTPAWKSLQPFLNTHWELSWSPASLDVCPKNFTAGAEMRRRISAKKRRKSPKDYQGLWNNQRGIK